LFFQKKKIIEIAKIHFTSGNNVLVYVQDVVNKDIKLKVNHVLCFYLKMLYNLGRGEKATGLMLFVHGAKGFMLYNKEGRLNDNLEVIGIEDDITKKCIMSEFFEDRTIRTKIPWGHEKYASKSVLAFLEYLNKTLPEEQRRLLWYSIDALHTNLIDIDNKTSRLPTIYEIVSLPVMVMTHVHDNWDEYENARKAGLEED